MQDMYLGRRAAAEELNNMLGATDAVQQMPARAGRATDQASVAALTSAPSGMKR